MRSVLARFCSTTVLACLAVPAIAEPWDSVPVMLTPPGSATSAEPAWARVGMFAPLGDRCVFWADNGREALPEEFQNELWISDATAAETRRLAAVAFEPVSVAAFVIAGRAYACFERGPHQDAVWTDGSPEGTFEAPWPGEPVAPFAGGTLFREGAALTLRDGTGARALGEVGEAGWSVESAGEHAGVLYLWLAETVNGVVVRRLASTDGTPAGTGLAAEWAPFGCGSTHKPTAIVEGRLVAVECDGTGAILGLRSMELGTRAVSRILLPDGLGAQNGVIAAPEGGRALVVTSRRTFLTDGTSEGTTEIQRGLVGTAGVLGSLATPEGARTVFLGADAAYGIEPWATDGTAEGTFRIAEVWPGRGSSAVRVLGGREGRVWFAVSEGTWVTDGTPGGTTRVTPLTPEAGPSSQPNAATAGDSLCFRTGVSGQPDRVLAVDASGQSVEIGPERPTWAEGPFSAATAAGGHGVFLWNEPGRGPGVYTTDGTSRATSRVADLDPGRAWSSVSGAAGLAWFWGSTADPSVNEVWRSDGTPAGTFPVGAGPGVGGPFVEGAGGVVFGSGLYWSDGTPGPLTRNGAASVPQIAVSPGGRVYYFRSNANQHELCMVDLTTGEFSPVAGVPRLRSAPRLQMRFFGERALFVIRESTSALWLLEGAASARQLASDVTDLESAGGSGLVISFNARGERSAWLADPASGALTGLAIPLGSNAVKLAAWAGRAVLLTNPGAGLEVWTVDGAGGVVRVAQEPGATPAFASNPAVIGGELVFGQSGPGDAYAAAAVDLTSGEVRRLGRRGEAPGLRPLFPGWFVPAGGSVLSRAWTEASGWQLYAVRRCAADYAADGFLDLFDWSAYVDSFEAGAPDADFNGDGFVDFFDYDGFLGAFEAGC